MSNRWWWVPLAGAFVGGCDGSAALIADSSLDAGLQLVSNVSPASTEGDAGPRAVPVVMDAGAPDAQVDGGGVDAGPLCSGLSVFDGFACEPVLTVRLTGQAFSVWGDALIAGYGQPPTLTITVSGPLDAGFTLALLHVQALSEGGAQPAISQPVGELVALADGGGLEAQLSFEVNSFSEGRYHLQAQASVGDAGFDSNVIALVVDRTPPQVSLTFDALQLDGGPYPRNFRDRVHLLADDGEGSGAVALTLFGAGPAMLGGVSAGPFSLPAHDNYTPQNISLAPVTVEGSTARSQAAVNGANLPYDAWSTAQDNQALSFTASATDRAGNIGSVTVAIPVTRAIWNTSGAHVSGQMALGQQGEIIWSDALGPHFLNPTTLEMQNPSGLFSGAHPGPVVWLDPAGQGQTIWMTVDSSDRLLGGGLLSYLAPSTWSADDLSAGATFITSAVSAAQQTVYAADSAGGIAFQPNPNVNPYATGGGSPGDYPTPGLALGPNNVLVTSSLHYRLTDASPSVKTLFAGEGPKATPASGAIANGVAWIPDARGLIAVYLNDVDWTIQVPGVAVSWVTVDSQGNLVLVSGDGQLRKVSPDGTTQWTQPLAVSANAGLGGPVLASDGTIYVVDGKGSLCVFDAGGLLHWKSPPIFEPGATLLDNCNGVAYLSTVAGEIQAMLLDSTLLDSSNGAWPMPGHDLLQTSDSMSLAAPNCASHQ